VLWEARIMLTPPDECFSPLKRSALMEVFLEKSMAQELKPMLNRWRNIATTMIDQKVIKKVNESTSKKKVIKKSR
jgi:hypothetical protein